MHIVDASDEFSASLGEELDSLCSLLPVRWGPAEIALRRVALVDGRVVGQVTVLEEPLPSPVRGLLDREGVTGEFAECADLVVRSSHRGLGVAKALLESLHATCADRGLRLVALVGPEHPAGISPFLTSGWTALGQVGAATAVLGPAPAR